MRSFRFFLFIIALFSIEHMVYAKTSTAILSKESELTILVKELDQYLVTKVEYAKWYLGAPVEQRIIMESLNNVCRQQGKALDPAYTVCSSPLTGHSNCSTVCTGGNWTPPWSIISVCGDRCGEQTVILDHDKIRGDILINKEVISPVFRILGKLDSTNIAKAKKIVQKFCSENYNSDLGFFDCGDSFDIEYGRCNSKYEYYGQCVALCNE